jgi:hypothetical protein
MLAAILQDAPGLEGQLTRVCLRRQMLPTNRLTVCMGSYHNRRWAKGIKDPFPAYVES